MSDKPSTQPPLSIPRKAVVEVVAGINLQHLRNLRESLPALEHRTLTRC